MLNSHGRGALSLSAGAKSAGRRPRAAAIPAVLVAAVAAVSLAALAAVGPAAAPDAYAQQGAACREGLESIMKNADGSTACVSPSTKAVLIARGWGSEPVQAEQGMAAGSMDDAMADAGGMVEDGMSDAMDGSTAGDGTTAGGMVEDGMSDAMDGSTAGDGTTAGGMVEDGMADTAMDVPEVELTDAEAARLAEPGAPVRVAYDPYRIPVEFYDDVTDKLGGVSGEYLDWLDAALPADFVPADKAALEARGEPGAPVRPHEAVRDGIADVAISIDPADGMRGYMSFAGPPHTALPIVMATADGSTVDAGSLSDMKVGAVSGYGAARWLDDTSVDYTGYATGIGAVQALAAGEIDVFVGLWVVAFHTGMMMEVDVTNAGPTGQSEMLSVGYASSDAALGSAIEKALGSVPDEMKEGITAMVSADPLEALTGALAADETGASMLAMSGEIDELNSVGDELVPQLLNLPEAVAFAQKHPGYTDTFYPLSSESVELELRSEADGASLRIEYSLAGGSPTGFTYHCNFPDGTPGDTYTDDDLAEKMATLCVP